MPDIVKKIFHRLSPKKKLVIIGCGRSGTTFSAKVFNALGLDFYHEKGGKDGQSSWYQTVNPILHKQYKFIIHQIREPLACISSAQTFNEPAWNYISKHININGKDDQIIKCAKYWYYWNLLAEKQTSLRVKIEQFYDHLPFICKFLDIPYNEEVLIPFFKEKQINTRKGRFNEVTWEMIRSLDVHTYDKCISLAEKYNYI